MPMTASRQRVTHNKYQVLDASEDLNMMMNMNGLVWSVSATFVLWCLSFNNIWREMAIWIYGDKDVIYFGPLNSNITTEKMRILFCISWSQRTELYHFQRSQKQWQQKHRYQMECSTWFATWIHHLIRNSKWTRLESTWSSEKGLNLNVERNWS